MDGILIVDKPEGFTSHDVVARTRRVLRTKRVGHTGTLDPFATGVLVLLVGRATRLARFLDKDAKEYVATVRFGFATDTGDLTGSPKDELRITNYELRTPELEAVLPEFRGEIRQTPPMYSAKKIEGKKLYELARRGVEIERPAVKVTVYELEVIKDQRSTAKDQIQIRVRCSAGTYIRTLAEDVGRRLGVGAHLVALRRTRAGKFDLSRAVAPEKLEEVAAAAAAAAGGAAGGILVSMSEALSHLPEKRLPGEELLKVKNGMRLPFENGDFADGQAVRLTDEGGNLAAVGFYDRGRKSIQPNTVLL